MNIDIQSHQLKLDKGLETYINRKLKFALSRMEESISDISVNLSQTLIERELNGDDKLTEKNCYLKVTFYNLQIFEYEDTQTDLYDVIDQVIQKASHALARNQFFTAIRAANLADKVRLNQ